MGNILKFPTKKITSSSSYWVSDTGQRKTKNRWLLEDSNGHKFWVRDVVARRFLDKYKKV